MPRNVLDVNDKHYLNIQSQGVFDTCFPIVLVFKCSYILIAIAFHCSYSLLPQDDFLVIDIAMHQWVRNAMNASFII